MSRFVTRLTRVGLVVLVCMALAPVAAIGRDPHSPLVSPHGKFRGKTFEEWSVLYTEWVVQTNLGGQTPCDTVNGVRFLPYNTTPGTHEFHVRLRPGTPFVQTPFPVFGERYDDPNVPDDNPADPFVDFIFDTADVRVELDDCVLMNDTASNLCRYGYGPEYFDEPIVYAEPQPRGPNLNSVAALWTQGVGAVYRPLSRGRHTLVVDVVSVLGEYHLTYHITVTPH